MPKIKVLYFAGVKDITHKEHEDITIPGDSITLNELSKILIATYGSKFEEILSTSMYAVNMEYIEKESETNTITKDSNEVAIIPPVSGG